ncbi:hypothetical protein SEVIR_9G513500v4 [Setaria viridis]
MRSCSNTPATSTSVISTGSRSSTTSWRPPLIRLQNRWFSGSMEIHLEAWLLVFWNRSAPGNRPVPCRHGWQDPLQTQVHLELRSGFTETTTRLHCNSGYELNKTNAVVNILYLESPVGVGFSYAADTEVYKAMGDNMTASDSLQFLLKWLDRFPEYKNRDFFIVGESYAGHYVPELATAIQVAKITRPAEVPINLKGIALGNAILEFAAEQAALYEYLWQHAFISDSGHNMIAQNCKNIDDNSPLCSGAKDTAYGQIGNVDVYNVYAATCHDKKAKATGSNCMDLADPCAQYYVEAYLNQPEVQKVIRANTGLKYNWTRCRYGYLVVRSLQSRMPRVGTSKTELCGGWMEQEHDLQPVQIRGFALHFDAAVRQGPRQQRHPRLGLQRRPGRDGPRDRDEEVHAEARAPRHRRLAPLVHRRPGGRRVRDRVQGRDVRDGARVRAHGADRPAGPRARALQVLPRGEGAPQGRAHGRLRSDNRHASEPPAAGRPSPIKKPRWWPRGTRQGPMFAPSGAALASVRPR